MKNKIAFVAVGQAGGNIGQLFEQKGFSVLYINTSQEDLDTLEKAKFKYHIPNGEGCNKDRRKAKQLVIDDYDQIAAELEAKIKAELIFQESSSFLSLSIRQIKNPSHLSRCGKRVIMPLATDSERSSSI